MSRWKIVTGLLVIFLSGVLFGSAVTGLYIRHKIRMKVNALISGDSQVATELVMHRLSHSLSLSTDQEKAIRPLVQLAVTRVRVLRAKLRPQFEEIFLETVEEIKQHLNEEQKGKLDELAQRIRNGLSFPKKVQSGLSKRAKGQVK